MTIENNGNDEFSGRKYINLESYNLRGEPKRTPVQSMEYNGLIYVRTDPKTWKVRRIRKNPHVRIVISDRNGKPMSNWVDAEAQIVESEEKRNEIQNVFKKAYGRVGNSIVNLVARGRGEQLTEVITIKLSSQLRSTC